eukprot:scaffold182824_cov22-Tisochrysis_lutea.AAC.1
MPVLARQALMTSTAAATLFAAGSANAATEIMDIAAIDNRVALLGTLFVPVLGWVAFNILPGLFRQLEVRGTVPCCVPGCYCADTGMVKA